MFFSPTLLVMSLAHSQSQVYSDFLLLRHHCPSTPPRTPCTTRVLLRTLCTQKQLLLWAFSWVPRIKKGLGSPIGLWALTAAPVFCLRPLGSVCSSRLSCCVTLLCLSQPQHSGNFTASVERKPSREPSVVRTKCPSYRAECSLWRLLSVSVCPGLTTEPHGIAVTN